MIRIKWNMFFILFLFVSVYTGLVVQSVTIFFSVILHELGHAIVAKRLGVKVEEIELFPFGGVARMEDITKYGGYLEAYIGAAGPAVSGFIALVGAALAGRIPFFESVYQYNFILFTFNLLPALPLDGGRIIRNLLMRHMSYKQSTKAMVLSGRLAAIALVCYNIILIYQGSFSVAYIGTAIFIYLGCHKEMKYCSYFYLLHKNNYKIGKNIKSRNIYVYEDTEVRFAVNQLSPGANCVICVVDHTDRILYKLLETDVMDALLKYGYDSKIGDIER